MDIEKLKYFKEIARVESYSAAAENLYISQAALSKYIIALEKELGVILIDRSKRKISVTHEGRLLLSHAVKLIEDYDRMLAHLKPMGSHNLIVATMPIMVQYGITKLISDFSALNPSINLSVRELDNNNIHHGLTQREYELAFIRRDSLDTQELETLDIFEDKLVLIMSKNHRLSDKRNLLLSELKDERFLFLSKETTLYDFSYNACLKAGFEPAVVFTGSRADNIVELVSNNLGVSMLMLHVANSLENDNIVITPVEGMPISHISLARLKHSNYSKPAQMLWQYVRDN